MYPDRFAMAASVSYVTGSHNVKVGIQDTWGRYRQFRSANGDIRALFNNVTVNGQQVTQAFQATILNTPLNFQDNLDADLGIYGQDSWTFKRLTLNYGARWEYFTPAFRKRRRATAASSLNARSDRSRCRPGRASRRAAASSTTCSAIRRRR
jgi:hypothetical protein